MNLRPPKFGGGVGVSGILPCWEASPQHGIGVCDSEFWDWDGSWGDWSMMLTTLVFSEQCDFTEDQTAGR